jgi:predicted GNAT family N-acyltransferase
LRLEVFVGEQGIPAEEEYDRHDATALHVVAVQFGRMAVESSFRRRGIGGSILSFLEDQARSRGAARVILNSQSEAVSFYRRHGYVAEGGPFFEVDIEHQRMVKELG